MMKIYKKILVILAVVAIIFGLGACKKRDQTNFPLAGKKFAIVVKSEGNKYFKMIAEGFCTVIEAQGGTTILREPSFATAEEQIMIINELISEDVDCIAIAANSELAIGPVLQKAMDKGIKVLSFDSAVDPINRALHVNQADAKSIAKALMSAAADISGGEGQIAIMSTTNQANNQNTWIEEMRTMMEAKEYPGLTLVNIVYGEDDYQITYKKTQFLIDTYPELSVIIAPTAAGIPAVAECIAQNGLEDRIRLTGLGMPSQMESYVGANRACPYIFLWDLDEVGKLTAYAAIALVEETINGMIGESLIAGEMGEYIISKDSLGGSEIVLRADPIRYDENNISE